MSIANGVVVCDNFDEIVLVNSSAKTMLEIENDDVLGTKIQEMYNQVRKNNPPHFYGAGTFYFSFSKSSNGASSEANVS